MALDKSIPRSLIASSFFTVMYSSIFYLFNLSFSTLFYNPMFWFAISNTLIFIIKIDYSSYSKDRNVQVNHQEEYTSQYPDEVVKQTIIEHHVANRNIESRENKQTLLEDEHEVNPSVDEIVVQERRKVHVQSKGGNKKIFIQEKAYKSEELKRVVINESKSIVMKLETGEKHEETQVSTHPEEDNELSEEELSRRFQCLRSKLGIKLVSTTPEEVPDNDIPCISDDEMRRKSQDLMNKLGIQFVI